MHLVIAFRILNGYNLLWKEMYMIIKYIVQEKIYKVILCNVTYIASHCINLQIPWIANVEFLLLEHILLLLKQNIAIFILSIFRVLLHPLLKC